jgi:hypothetical protein
MILGRRAFYLRVGHWCSSDLTTRQKDEKHTGDPIEASLVMRKKSKNGEEICARSFRKSIMPING